MVFDRAGYSSGADDRTGHPSGKVSVRATHAVALPSHAKQKKGGIESHPAIKIA